MELTINSRFLVLSLIVCCLIYVTSVEANVYDNDNASDSGSGSGSDSDSGSGSASASDSSCDNCNGSDNTSSTTVATFTPTEDTEDTDFILLRTPYLYIWPPVLLVIILMCCCLCGMCLCLYIYTRRRRRTCAFTKFDEALKNQENLELSDNLFPKVDKVVTLEDDMGIESDTIGMVSDTVTTNDEGNKESTTDKEDNQKIKEGMPSEENGEENKDTIDKEGSKENTEGMEAKQDVEESKEVTRETKEDSVAIKEDDKEGNQTFETKKKGEDKDVTTIKDEVLTSSEIANNESIAPLLPVVVGQEPNKSASDQQRHEETNISFQADKPEEQSKPQVTISEDKTTAPLQELDKETITPETNVGLQEKTPDVPKITIEINDINPISSMQVEQTNDMTTTTTSVDKEIVKETSDISTGSTQKEDTSPQEEAKASDVGLDISFDTILESILKSEDIKEDKANPKTTSKEEKEVQVVYL